MIEIQYFTQTYQDISFSPDEHMLYADDFFSPPPPLSLSLSLSLSVSLSIYLQCNNILLNVTPQDGAVKKIKMQMTINFMSLNGILRSPDTYYMYKCIQNNIFTIYTKTHTHNYPILLNLMLHHRTLKYKYCTCSQNVSYSS